MPIILIAQLRPRDTFTEIDDNNDNMLKFLSPHPNLFTKINWKIPEKFGSVI